MELKRFLKISMAVAWVAVSGPMLFAGATAEIQFPVTITYPETPGFSVQVAGTFWGWDKRPLYSNGKGLVYRILYLPQGLHRYKLVLNDEQWVLDPNNPARVSDPDGENSVIEVGPAGVVPPNLVWHEFVFTNDAAGSVSIAGNFNDWSPDRLPMTQSGDLWRLRVALTPGDHEYKFVVDGNWIHDPGNPLRASNYTGTENSLVTVFPAQRSAPRIPPIALGPLQLFAGTYASFDIPFSAAAWEDANRFARMEDQPKANLPEGSMLECSLLLPPGFDPRRTWPILVVSGPDGWPNTDHLFHCFTAAAEAGYVAVAAEGFGSRWAQAASALEYLHQHWPASRQWPVAFGGFSGGAKVSALLAAQAVKTNRRVIGVWMGGCNEDGLTSAVKLYQVNTMRAREVPVYLASGTTDDIATPEQCAAVKQSLVDGGFKKIRLEAYPGGHHPVPQDKVREGLLWFRQQAGLMNR